MRIKNPKAIYYTALGFFIVRKFSFFTQSVLQQEFLVFLQESAKHAQI